MNRTTGILIVIILLSIGFNIALWFGNTSNPTQIKNTPVVEKTTDKTATKTSSPDSLNTQEQTLKQDEELPSNLNIAPLRRLLKNGEYIELGRRLRDALRVLPNNTELLLMEAEFIAKTQPLSEAILNYYSLLDRPFDPNTHKYIQDKIDELSSHGVLQLQKSQQWDMLAQFMEPLFQRVPDNKTYILTLAEAYGQQENFSLMESVLASLDELDPQAITLKNQMYANQQRPANTSEFLPTTQDRSNSSKQTDSVALIRSRDHFLVDITIEQTPVRLLIDTGASITALSARTVDRLTEKYDAEFLGVFQVSTASGVIDAPMVAFRELQLGKFTFSDLPVIVLPSDPFDEAEGLLGMNVLRAFDFKIDQKTPALQLRQF
ncbi:clan AA aspartic protease [Alteromonas sp. 5E99-2]|uniref:retroviral-like aspartic protease family protein n=1 Tax=Alteromonas sp. 5E99-2 TaxID=2817683 RepID=UPI001A99AEF6|nr:clan AA aspartic protease [Alteromonas sp. 5E99-2]